MTDFHEYLQVNNDVFDFEFAEVLNPGGSKYFVKVFKGFELLFSFEMKQDYAQWNIVPPVPFWIDDLRAQLEKAISRYKNRQEH